MYVIDAIFKKFNEVTLYDVLGEIGVYVFWGYGEKRPLWIGEGDLMTRLGAGSYFSSWTNGYVTVFNSGSLNQNKRDSEIVEHALLSYSKKKGIFPTKNKKLGKQKSVNKIIKYYGKIRINIRHRNPLKPPSGYNKLIETLVLDLEPEK